LDKINVKMEKFNIKHEAIIIIFIFAFIGIGIYSYLKLQYKFTPATSLSKCPIEYGYLKCLKEKPRIPFYNPNDMDLENIQVVVPKENGRDIYQVNGPLKAKEVQVLTLLYHNCNVTKKMKKLSVKWCCGSDCYESLLLAPSDKITMEINKTYEEK